MERLALATAAVLLLAAAPAAAHEDIALATLAFPAEIATWYEKEYQRVEKLCGLTAGECWSRELPRKAWVLNAVHSAPDARAPQVGAIVLAVMTEAPDDWPRVRFDFRPSSGPQVVWLGSDEIGDWGYGIYVVVRMKADPSAGAHSGWIQVAGVPQPAWLKLAAESEDERTRVTGEVEPLGEHVLQFDAGVRATNRRTGERVQLPAGAHYVAERVADGQVFLRQEVGADMPCGDDAEKDVPTRATPRYRVRIDDLFKSNGKPRVKLAYPKGC